MKYTLTTVGLLLATGIGAVLAGGCSRPAAIATASENAKPVRWEYAEFVSDYGADVFGKRTMSIRWEGPAGEQVTAKSFSEFAEQKKIKLERENTTSVLNAVADDGWEVLSHSVVHGGPGIMHIWMLRRAK